MRMLSKLLYQAVLKPVLFGLNLWNTSTGEVEANNHKPKVWSLQLEKETRMSFWCPKAGPTWCFCFHLWCELRSYWNVLFFSTEKAESFSNSITYTIVLAKSPVGPSSLLVIASCLQAVNFQPFCLSFFNKENYRTTCFLNMRVQNHFRVLCREHHYCCWRRVAFKWDISG